MTKPTHTADRSRPSATSGALRRGVKALVSTRGAVLLVREEHDDGSAFWTLPGGGLRPSEPPAAGLRRELREELGCAVVVGRPTESAHQSVVGRGRKNCDCTARRGALGARLRGERLARLQV